MTLLKKITIENVKGIKSKKVMEVNLSPNKVSILVAPNGFGKSSTATAFKSLKPKKGLVLDEKDRVNGKDISIPFLEMEYENDTYSDKEIIEKFDVNVINSPLKAKSGGTFGGANIIIPTIELIPTIPKKDVLKYKLSKGKLVFGIQSKILIDVTGFFKNLSFFSKLLGINKKKLDSQKFNEAINKFKDNVNSLSGTSDNIKDKILELDSYGFNKIHNEVNKIIVLITEYFKVEDKDLCLCAYQVINIIKTEKLKDIYKYKNYECQKKNYDNLLSDFNTRDDKIKTKEFKKKKLVVEFPNNNLISNGQRDSLTLVIQMEKIKNKIINNEKPIILIIDEVFDYLDNANLIAVQYYISKFVNYCKKEKQKLYPIILTHLDPCLLSNYVFNKPKVVYLNKTEEKEETKDRFFDLIKKRENKNVKDDLSKYFMHYHNEEKDISNKINGLGFKKDMGKNKMFYDMLKTELENYKKDEPYKPFGVALGLRIITEEYLYKKIGDKNKEDFLGKNGTKKKIDFYIEKGEEVSEIFGMLSILHNDCLHISKDDMNGQNDMNCKTKLSDKLSHPVIKNMISKIWDDYTKQNNKTN